MSDHRHYLGEPPTRDRSASYTRADTDGAHHTLAPRPPARAHDAHNPPPQLLEGTDGHFYFIDESESPVKSELSSASPAKSAGPGKFGGGGGFPEIAGRGVMPAPRG